MTRNPRPRPRNPGGAPRGNVNALKHGRYSDRARALHASLQVLHQVPDLARFLRAERRQRHLLAHGLRIVADLLLAYPGPETTGDITPRLISKAARIAGNSPETTEQPAPVLPGLPKALTARHNHHAMPEDRPIRVLIAKPGLDGHDRGAKVVARALRDAGMEVIYTGIRQTPDMIAESALQEDADVIGLSILSGAHLELFPRVIQALKDRGIGPDDVLLFAGGIIPDDDIPQLKDIGFAEVFRPGSSTRDIIDFVNRWAQERKAGVRA